MGAQGLSTVYSSHAKPRAPIGPSAFPPGALSSDFPVLLALAHFRLLSFLVPLDFFPSLSFVALLIFVQRLQSKHPFFPQPPSENNTAVVVVYMWVASLHGSREHGVVSRDAGALLVVLGLGVAHPLELGGGRQHGAPEPYREALHVVRDDFHLWGGGVDLLDTGQMAHLVAVGLHAVFHDLGHVALQTFAKVLWSWWLFGGQGDKHGVVRRCWSILVYFG